MRDSESTKGRVPKKGKPIISTQIFCRRPMRLLWPLTLLSFCFTVPGSATERFDERLTLRTLQDGRVASKFTFTTLLKGASPRDPRTLDASDDCGWHSLHPVYHNLNHVFTLVQHYTVFPLALGQILREYAVSELHLTLNAGNWNYDRWGYPEEKGVGTGAELWAWMGQGTTTWVSWFRCLLKLTGLSDK